MTWSGETLRQQRLQLGVSVEALAVASGVDAGAIRCIELDGEPYRAEVAKLTDGLNAIARNAGVPEGFVAGERGE